MFVAALSFYVLFYLFTVLVTLNSADQIDQVVENLKGQLLNGRPADVRHNPCNRLLCVANLPSSMDENSFRQLMQVYGKLERCFMMRDSEGKEF